MGPISMDNLRYCEHSQLMSQVGIADTIHTRKHRDVNAPTHLQPQYITADFRAPPMATAAFGRTPARAGE